MVKIALPSAQTALHFATVDRQYVMTAYTLALGLLLGGALTEYLSWRWTLYVNLFFAGLALAAAAVLLTREPTRGGQRLDVSGATYFS